MILVHLCRKSTQSTKWYLLLSGNSKVIIDTGFTMTTPIDYKYPWRNGRDRRRFNWPHLGLSIFCSFAVARLAKQHAAFLPSSPNDAIDNAPQGSNADYSAKDSANDNTQENVHNDITNYLLKSANNNETRWPIDLYQAEWPVKLPSELVGADKFNNCQVHFRDRSMALCHLGAFNGNFGDMLGPDITKRILEYRFGCSAAMLPVVDFEITTVTQGPCLWTVGSVFRLIRPNDHVWGTGSHGKWLLEFSSGPCAHISRKKGKKSSSSSNNITIYAVRGPQTAQMVQKYCKNKVQSYQQAENRYTVNLSGLPDAGDAGFLIPFLFPEIGVPRDDPLTVNSCIILHKYDEKRSVAIKEHMDDQLLPVVQPWRSMVNSISRCRVVSSSSLHGLIVADALGIPSRWIKGSKHILSFKFVDYFRSVGFATKEAARRQDLKTILRRTLPLPKTLSYLDRSAYAQKILQAFPYHLFQVHLAET